MQLSYADRVYIKQQYPAQKLQQGFLNSIKQYYDSQDSRTCRNNDNELYIYLSAMFHNTEVKGSNIEVLTQYTDLDNNNAYGDPTKLFQALFTNKAFLRWKQNSFDLNVDQTMMHIEDERFIWLQHDTETIFKIKQTNRQLEESEGNLIYIMCHTRPNYHWMDEWFEAEAEQLNMKNIEYKYVDAMPNDQFETHDIVADVFAGNKENALADIVYAPDCDGIWGKLFSGYNQGIFQEALQKLFQWVKDGGYLYVSKLSDEAIEYLKQIGFEAVTHTLEAVHKVTMYRRQKKPETIIEAVGDNLMQKAIFNTGFGLPLTSDSLLINNKVHMLNNKAISIDKASKYFFVTTQFNESVKPFKIQINKKKYYLASAVVATAIVDEYGEADETYSAGGHYVAVWVHKGLKKAFRLDSLDPDGTKASNTRELNTVDEIQEELKSAQILIYAREKYIDYDRYDKEIKLLQQTRYLCFLNAGLNALRYIKPFYEAISSNVQEVPRQQADVQSNLSDSQAAKDWKCIGYFKVSRKETEHVQLQHNTNGKKMVAYKSNSGMLWHMAIFNGIKYLKLGSECGLYANSFIIDLALQQKICTFAANNTATIIPDDKATEWRASLFYRDKYDGWLNTYTSKQTSITTECPDNSKFSIFSNILDKLSNIPLCGGMDPKNRFQAINKRFDWEEAEDKDGKLKDTFELYKEWSQKFSNAMSENFDKLNDDILLYKNCNSNTIDSFIHDNSGYDGWSLYENVQVSYDVYRTTLVEKESNSGNSFYLVYAKYRFLKPDNIDLRSTNFVIPLFISDTKDSYATPYPVYNNIAHVGLYTCKIFEYRMQIYGKKRQQDTRYVFLGDSMNNMWPFENSSQTNLIISDQDNLEFAKGVYIKPNDTVTNNFLMDLFLRQVGRQVGVKAYIENALDNKADDTIVNNILRPEIQKIIKNKKIICHYNIDELLKIKDLKRHLIVKNSYLNQTVIEHYINVLKHGRHYKEFSVNAMDKNIIIFELVHVHNKGALSNAMVRNHYDILKYYFHLIKFKTSSAFNDVINIPVEDEREYGVKCSNYILQNLKTIFKRRNTNEALQNKRRFVYDQIELKLDKLQSILIPVGDGKAHFWLYHIWFDNSKSIGHIDCYNKNYGIGKKYIEEHAEYIKKIEEWLRNKLPTIKTWQPTQLLDVQQGNAACGVYVCQLIREIVKAYPKKWNERVDVLRLQDKLYKRFTCTDNANKEYIEKCREYMCVELIENRILNYNKLN